MNKLESVYARLPLWGQHLAVSLYGLYWHWLRFGPGYKAFVHDYLEREQFSEQEWRAWQQTQLKQILQTAATNVPYYNRVWSREEKSAAMLGRLVDLPLLEKGPLRHNAEDFVRDDLRPRPKLVFHTSGSTGTPIASIWTVDDLRDSLALREVRSARWAGTSFKLPRATFSGRIVEPDSQKCRQCYRFNTIERQVYFSAFHLSHKTAQYYIEALHKHNIQWLTGYAVSYYHLAKFILEQELQVPPLRAVVTTSEKITPPMRQAMERAYDCPVFEEYSTVENVIFASECEHGRLHVSPDVSVVEILKQDGTPCEPGEIGEVVVTSLARRYQPFIRYCLGDLAMWDAEACPCVRAMPVLKEVVGRIEDVVIGPDGRQMVRFHGIFVDQPHVREGQIIQEAIDRIRVKVATTPEFNGQDVRDIQRRIQQRLGLHVLVVVEPVESIPRTAAGKFQAVVSELRDRLPEVERTGIVGSEPCPPD